MSSKVAGFFVLLSLLAAAALGALAWVLLREPAPERPPAVRAPRGRGALIYAPALVGAPGRDLPHVGHLAIADLDGDARLDIVVADTAANQIGWIRQEAPGTFRETAIGSALSAPARIAIGDVSGEGLPDVLVAARGRIAATDDLVGQVILLENRDGATFTPRALVGSRASIGDVRLADFTGDGRLDVLVVETGVRTSSLSWLENLGDGAFATRAISATGFCIAAAVGDFDRDGRIDFVALTRGRRDEVRLFRNAGAEGFREELVSQSAELRWGASAIETCDLNRDGWPDLLVANGEPFTAGRFAEPRPGHGVQWLENRRGTFHYRPIGALPGAQSPVALDLDADGDLDVLAVSACNQTLDPRAVWLAAWLNDGKEAFSSVSLSAEVFRLGTVAAGDLDGNEAPVLITGGHHAYPPFTQLSRVTLWRRL